MKMNENIKHDIDFYKYVLMKITDVKSDIHEKILELDNPNFYNCKDYSDSISSITGIESLVDSVFFEICTGKMHEGLYNEVMNNLNYLISGPGGRGNLGKKQIATFKSAKEFMNNIHEEWLNRKEDS